MTRGIGICWSPYPSTTHPSSATDQGYFTANGISKYSYCGELEGYITARAWSWWREAVEEGPGQRISP